MANPDFIEVYDDALGITSCASLIERFEAGNEAVRGATGSGVDTALKDSWDINISGIERWGDAVQMLNRAMFAGLKQYVLRYAHVALAPVSLRMPDPAGGAAVLLDPERVRTLDAPMLEALISTVFRPGNINVQKYHADQGGYPYWHSELYPGHADSDTLHRVLLWSIYLNDGFGGGETEFFYQQRRVVPRTGSLLIAPAGFTHTHRGNMPRGGDKYIATSWILFQPAAALYGSPGAR